MDSSLVIKALWPIYAGGPSGSQLKSLNSQLPNGKSSLENPNEFEKIQVNPTKSN
jgi:hypothetical protein